MESKKEEIEVVNRIEKGAEVDVKWNRGGLQKKDGIKCSELFGEDKEVSRNDGGKMTGRL